MYRKWKEKWKYLLSNQVCSVSQRGTVATFSFSHSNQGELRDTLITVNFTGLGDTSRKKLDQFRSIFIFLWPTCWDSEMKKLVHSVPKFTLDWLTNKGTYYLSLPCFLFPVPIQFAFSPFFLLNTEIEWIWGKRTEQCLIKSYYWNLFGVEISLFSHPKSCTTFTPLSPVLISLIRKDKGGNFAPSANRIINSVN